MPNSVRVRQRIIRLSALFVMLFILSLSFYGSACRPVPPTTEDTLSSTTVPSQQESSAEPTGTSTETSSTADATSSSSTDSSTSDTGATASESSIESSTDSSTASDPSATSSESTTASQSGQTGTPSDGTVTTRTTTQPSSTRPVTTTSTGQPTTKPATTASTAATTAIQTTAATTAPPGSNFPVRNYGAFFRNEYGTNANIVSSEDGGIQIDVGSAPEGVVLVKIISIPTDKRCKIVLIGPDAKAFQYEIPSRNTFEGLPLQMGSGTYKMTIYEQVSGTSYSTKMAHTFSVSLGSSLKPFTASSIIVNFSTGSSSTSRASSLSSGKSSQVAKIEAVYLWIVDNIVYDRVLAASITSGELKAYIPSPDRTMSTRKGICYDYAALMAAMLRSQGIPTRLIMGQVPQGYHAWNEVYLQGTGWVVIASFNYAQVDGSAWVMFDSTFAAGGMSSQTILNTTHTKERTY